MLCSEPLIWTISKEPSAAKEGTVFPEVTLLSIHQELLLIIAFLALGVSDLLHLGLVISWKNAETNTSYRKL